MKKSGIYQIKNKVNNKLYIGSASNLTSRKSRHFIDLGLNKHHSVKLQRAFNKYGVENFDFEILEECEQFELIPREQYYIDNLKPSYNICPLAGSNLGSKHSKEALTRRKIYMKNRDYSKAIKRLNAIDRTGSKNPQSKLNEVIVSEIKRQLFDGLSPVEIYNRIKIVSLSAIYRISQNKTWKHVII